MRNLVHVIVGISLASCLTIPLSTAAQDVGKKSCGASSGGALPASRNGPVEAFLAKRTGEYVTRTKFLNHPSEPEMIGTARITTIIGGKFIREETFTEAYGAHSEVHLYGYDHIRSEYQAVWMDSTSQRIQMMTGTSSNEGMTVIYSGWTGIGCIGLSDVVIRIDQLDDDHIVVTMMTRASDGKESAFQETSYTRKT
ncbi:MAG: DUF1579 family protein [Candidatus Acidiferrales bacterium]